MNITKINNKKYSVIHNGKTYTCYIDAWNGNLVVTGNGNTKDFKNITNTKLGMEIILACNNA